MPRSSSRHWILVFVVGTFVATSPLTTSPVHSSLKSETDSGSDQTTGAETVRTQVEQQKQLKQQSEKELTLRQGAATVASQRVQQLQKQLEEAQARAATEMGQVEMLKGQLATIDQSIASLTAAVPAHEAADLLVKNADKISGRLETLLAARQQLQAQLSTLRKSSVEWRSKVSDADQQIAAIAAQRPELDKKLNEAKPAAEAADKKVMEVQAALVAVQSTHDAAATALTKEETLLTEATTSVQRLTTSITSLERSLTTLKEASRQTGVDSSAALQGLEKALADLAPLKTNTDQLVAQVTSRRDQQAKLVAASKTELETKTAEHQAALAAAEAPRAALKVATDAVADANRREKSLKSVKQEGETWQTTLQAQLTGLEPALQKLNAELQIVTTESLVARRNAENALEPLGRFVSFSKQVAPILADRCIACHNTRSPGGRLNLDSFAALLKGGESGDAMTAGQSHDSLLVSMIEDGSMPKDADPLKAEEIAVLRHWIDVGAPLDAGVLATADLFDVIPERSQPQAPTEYRVAIPVTAVAFSSDGSQLASSGYHEVLVWNTSDGSLIRRISNIAERVYDLEFSADGTTLAVAAGTPGQLGELKLFSAIDGTLQRTLVRSRDAVFALSFSPDGQRIACGGADRSVSVINVASGEELTRIEDHADWVMDINWSPDGQQLVSSSRDKTCKVFEAVTGNPVITFPGHGEPVYTAAFLADGKTVASGGGDKRIRIWNTADAKEVRSIGGFGGDVFRLHIQPGDLILAASGDRQIHQNKAADGAEIRRFSGHTDWVYTLSVNPDGKLIASGSYDGEIRLWNAEDGSVTTSFLAIPKGRLAVAASVGH